MQVGLRCWQSLLTQRCLRSPCYPANVHMKSAHQPNHGHRPTRQAGSAPARPPWLSMRAERVLAPLRRSSRCEGSRSCTPCRSIHLLHSEGGAGED